MYFFQINIQIKQIFKKNIINFYFIKQKINKKGDNKNALKYFDLVSSAVPSDPGIHCKLGMLYSSENDEAQAFHHFSESHKLLPTNLNAIAWLGIFYVKNCNYHKAAQFFEIAAKTNSKDLKWKLMIASCYRRMDQLQKALDLYKEVNEKDPENMEALKFIGKLF